MTVAYTLKANGTKPSYFTPKFQNILLNIVNREDNNISHEDWLVRMGKLDEKMRKRA